MRVYHSTGDYRRVDICRRVKEYRGVSTHLAHSLKAATLMRVSSE